jgi:phosphonate transport system permease protein
LLVGLWLTAPVVEVDFVRLFGSLGRMVTFAGQMFVTPDWEYVPQLLAKMLETIEMTVLGTAIAVVVSLPLGILAASNATPHPVVYRVTRDL